MISKKLTIITAAFAALASCASQADEVPRILQCNFTTECNPLEGQCVTQEDPILSFTLVVAEDGETAHYQGDESRPPMQVQFNTDGVLMIYDMPGGTLTSIGAEGVAVHSSNLILLGHRPQPSQWTGSCRTR
ncbi:hypothetical protein [Pararhodobacter sp. CCB-MM2]|uniref:hypothetical protein n=1 Tax=Pararhodobacter sp. CCB-MM2 TaxID=1786003 RepID=UPI0008324930|nr:hypothetical protein [Pararhodobacter sp. CCB-MM2]MCA2010790.1 hypothetical protein [Cereibacter sphaeroides]